MAASAQVLQFPQGNAPTYSPTTEQENDDDYFELTRLRRQYYDYLGAADAEIKEAREARHYYHGSQWTSEEIKILQRRKQPVITSNRIVRKIDAVVGLVEKLRQDPKAYARTPQHEQGAELATAVLRYVLDSSDWKSKSTRISRLGAIDGIAGIEYDLEKGDQGDPELGLHIVYGDTFFYDKRSFDEGFTDARYQGVAKWVDVELAKELVPAKADDIDNLVETGSDMMSVADQDREKTWININEKKVRLVDHWYVKKGKWRWCLYIANVMLMRGTSPFVDNKGKTFPRFRMFSASVDHDGDRYGFVRNLKSPQDEINHRRSKALHNANSRRIITPKGAFDDIELARKEAAKPDGVLEYNMMPGEQKPEFDDARQFGDMKAQLEFLQEAKNEIENFGPNPALIGQGLEDSSGRAIALLQQAGLAELGPFLSAFKSWKIRVYRDIWDIVTRHWQAERWVRVTDDDGIAQFLQINKLQIDPMTGAPQMVNAIGSLDVDIIIDEGPDQVNMMADSYQVLQSLGPAFAQEFPEIALELSPIQNSIKKKMLDKLKEEKAKPPPPDPKVMAMQAQMQLKQEESINDFKLEQAKAQFEAQEQQRQTDSEMQTRQMEFEFDRKIEFMKADNAIKIERAKADVQMDIASQQARQDRQMARAKADPTAPEEEDTVSPGQMTDLVKSLIKVVDQASGPKRAKKQPDGTWTVEPVGGEDSDDLAESLSKVASQVGGGKRASKQPDGSWIVEPA